MRVKRKDCYIWFLVSWHAMLLTGCERADPPSKDAPALSAEPSREPSTESSSRSARSQAISPISKIRFADKTPNSGVDSVYRNGQEAGFSSILESLGGGVAVLDFDLDARDDLCFANGGGFEPDSRIRGAPTSLYRNLGGWKFAGISAEAGISSEGVFTHGVIAADADSDGFTDILMTGYGGLRYWQNRGDGTFVDATSESGLTDSLWSSSAGWGDLDGDGSLDLYVAHYVDWSFRNHPRCPAPRAEDREVCPPRSFSGLPDAIYFSNGDGTFRDGSEFCGIRKDGKGLGVLICDLDQDGDLDIYVANDTVENFLYENKGGGKFADVSITSATAFNDRGNPDGSMGVDVIDYNLDGRFDLWVSNYENENCALYQNLGQLFFRHVSQQSGVAAVGGTFVSWGTCGFDMDCDGDEDVFVSNGHVIRFPTNAPLRQTPLIFENLNGKRFINVARGSGDYMTDPHMGRGAATGDFDGDGKPDLVISHSNEPAAILENDSAAGNHWLRIQLTGVRSPRDAIGATVRIKTSTRTQIRQWRGGGSYASTNSKVIHFGVGAAAMIDLVEIHWPSGGVQTLQSIAADQTLQIIEK